MANEIKNLSESSRISALKIGELIVKIQEKIEKVSDAITLSNESLSIGLETSEDAHSIFKVISRVTDSLVTNAQSIDIMISNYQDNAKVISNEFTDLNQLSEEGTSSIGDIFKSIQEQNNQIEILSESFNELSIFIEELNDISKQSRKKD